MEGVAFTALLVEMGEDGSSGFEGVSFSTLPLDDPALMIGLCQRTCLRIFAGLG